MHYFEHPSSGAGISKAGEARGKKACATIRVS